jgi:hypothetical protein
LEDIHGEVKEGASYPREGSKVDFLEDVQLSLLALLQLSVHPVQVCNLYPVHNKKHKLVEVELPQLDFRVAIIHYLDHSTVSTPVNGHQVEEIVKLHAGGYPEKCKQKQNLKDSHDIEPLLAVGYFLIFLFFVFNKLLLKLSNAHLAEGVRKLRGVHKQYLP